LQREVASPIKSNKNRRDHSPVEQLEGGFPTKAEHKASGIDLEQLTQLPADLERERVHLMRVHAMLIHAIILVFMWPYAVRVKVT
jgi:hypothetical protein